jgi:hypothetical protein
MGEIREQLSEQFYEWERRGRGWQVLPDPTCLEPPFRPFNGYRKPPLVTDDGCRPTIFSSFLQGLSRIVNSEPASPPPVPEPEHEPEPDILIRGSLIELQASLPTKLDISTEAFEHFLLTLSHCREPIAFELFGTAERIIAQFAATDDDAPLLRRQLQAHFPEASFLLAENTLRNAWDECSGDEMFVVEFGLEREFFFPLASGKLDPFVGIIGALSELQPGELGLFQVLFEPVRNDWAESIEAIVAHSEEMPLFVNAPELAEAAKDKIHRPLFAAVVRIAIRAEDEARSLQLARDLAGSLRVFANPHGNALIPLKNDDYPFDNHVEDAMRRQSRRSGMLLNSEELIDFVHLPSSSVRSPALQRDAGKTRSAPAIVQQSQGVLLGNNLHAGKTIPVRLNPEQFTQHSHILGKQGTGKSTLLLNIIRQLIESGSGVAVLDPHGDLVDRILGLIPPHRIDDVVLVDPADAEYSVGFNILSAHSELEKNLLASDLVSMFQRLSTSWGDQLDSVFRNAVLAFLESDRRGTLHDLRRFLIEPGFRAKFLNSVSDPNILYYWQKVFPQLGSNKSIGPIATRMNEFLSRKSVSHMLAQPENRLDFGSIMDTGKIFLAKLSKGLLGDKDSYLLGTLIVSKFQQLAMARQAQAANARRDYTLVIDEFADFITPTMAQILTGARKYRLGLVLAHQELRQLQRNEDVASAVLANPFTRVCFRVGDDDARKMSDGFPHFEGRDLQNLGRGETIMRVERSDNDFNLTVPLFPEPEPDLADERRQAVIAASREKYARPRAEIEAALRQMIVPEPPPEKAASKPKVAEKESPSTEPEVGTVAEPPAVPKTAIAGTQTSHPSLPAKAEAPDPPSPPMATAGPEPKHSTVSEKRIMPAELGKGGAQHRAVQVRIKEAAEALGFLATIEGRLGDTRESVDVLMERPGLAIACEISISRTTIDHEVSNVAKCLKAGLKRIAVIALDDARLKAIEKAVAERLGSEAANAVSYCLPEQFIAELEKLPPMQPSDPPESATMRRGYKVKRIWPKLTPDEQLLREKAAIRVIAETLRKK